MTASPAFTGGARAAANERGASITAIASARHLGRIEIFTNKAPARAKRSVAANPDYPASQA
jgi:hypothetical protein